jgi:hypothetical protein
MRCLERIWRRPEYHQLQGRWLAWSADLSGSWPRRCLAMFFERGKNEFFGPFRKQHFFTGGMVAILVAEPVDCNRIDSIDWRQVWDKERHRIAADHASAPLRVRNQG